MNRLLAVDSSRVSTGIGGTLIVVLLMVAVLLIVLAFRGSLRRIRANAERGVFADPEQPRPRPEDPPR